MCTYSIQPLHLGQNSFRILKLITNYVVRFLTAVYHKLHNVHKSAHFSEFDVHFTNTVMTRTLHTNFTQCMYTFADEITELFTLSV